MKSSNPSFTGTPQPHPIRTSGREYANPVDYHHPYASMARFAQALALQ
ncbi:MAG: hypothetical protein ACTHLW_21865 [Verrucomicrobiota bacterium]